MKYIKDFKLEKRKEIRIKILKLIKNMEQQNILFKELYILPNEQAIKKSNEMLKNRISINEFEDILTKTREQYSKIINGDLKEWV